MPQAITTIDIPSVSTTPMVCPRNWTEAAEWLGTSQPSVMLCRKTLGKSKEPLSAELFQEIRRMVQWCNCRNNGGGSRCTHHEYMRLKALGQRVLEEELTKQGVII